MGNAQTAEARTSGKLTLVASSTTGGFECQASLLINNARQEIVRTTTEPELFSYEDFENLRWLIEDYPLIAGTSAHIPAQRMHDRLLELGLDLGRRVVMPVFEAAGVAILEPRALSRIRIVVRADHRCQLIPWELMLLPDREPIVASAESFSRTLYQEASAEEEIGGRPVKTRLLFVISRPKGRHDVSFRSVATHVVRELNRSNGAIELFVLRPPTWSALEATLAEAARSGRPFDILHFDGHGVYRPDNFTQRSRGYVVFEGEGEGDGGRQVDGATLGGLLAKYGVRTAVFNACRSAYASPLPSSQQPSTAPQAESSPAALGNRDDEQGARSFAMDLLMAGVPSVLAMGFNVAVRTAAELLADFYAELVRGAQVLDAAAESRRRYIFRHSGRDHPTLEWLIPLVYTRRTPVDHPDDRLLNRPDDSVTSVPDSALSNRHTSFIGYEDKLLEIERGLADAGAVQIVGLAGAGKTTLAAEFSEWAVATGLVLRHVPVDVARTTFHRFVEALSDSTYVTSATGRIQGGATDQPRGSLLVLDDVDALGRDAEGGRWQEADIQKAWSAIDNLRREGWLLLLTGRGVAPARGVHRVTLDGLDPADAFHLARKAGWEGVDRGEGLALLEWTSGIPALIRAAPDLLDRPPDADAQSYDPAAELRMGIVDPRVVRAWLSTCRLDFFRLAALSSPAVPVGLSLFSGSIRASDWKIYCDLVKSRGWEALADSMVDMFDSSELDFASSMGLAVRAGEDLLMIHPLASLSLHDMYAACMRTLAHGDSSLAAELDLRFISDFVNVMQVTARTQANLRVGAPVSRPWRQNLYQAIHIAMSGRMWAIAIPLVKVLRDELLSEAREPEWNMLLHRLMHLIRQDDDPWRQVGPEDVRVLLARLLEDEALRAGHEATAQQMRDASMLFLEASEATQGDGTEGGRVERNAYFTTLMRSGTALMKAGSPRSVDVLTQARDLVPDDQMRAAQAELAIARCYVNVVSLFDSEKYEFHARAALTQARRDARIRPEFLAECQLSVANAIIESAAADAAGTAVPGPRLDEARGLLSSALQSPHSTAYTRAAAHNGLARLYQWCGQARTAVQHALEACTGFEDLRLIPELEKARVTAALAMYEAGMVEEAREMADLIDRMGGTQDGPPYG